MIGVNTYHSLRLHIMQLNRNQWVNLHFSLMYHRDPKIPMDNLLAQTVSPYQQQLQPHETIALNFQLAWQNVRDNLQQHQRQQKQHYDKTVIPSQITPGSKVLI